jgi:hypothetical protein
MHNNTPQDDIQPRNTQQNDIQHKLKITTERYAYVLLTQCYVILSAICSTAMPSAVMLNAIITNVIAPQSQTMDEHILFSSDK